MNQMIFIVGVGRSGTSLLQSMLNAHPDICFPPEIGFIRRYLATQVLEKAAREKGIEAVIEDLDRDRLIGRLKFSTHELRNILASISDPLTSVAIYEHLLQAYAQNKGDFSYLGDKDPRSIEYLPLIHRHFPESHILHIIRDPRDVLASKKKAAWSKNRPSWSHIFANRVQFKLGLHFGRPLFGDRYMEITYEELIKQPQATLQRICNHLGIAFHSKMLEFGESGEELVAEEEMQWKKETLGPLLSKNVGKWKESLSPWEIALTENLCRHAFEIAGYQPSNIREHLGVGARVSLIFFAWGLRLMDVLYTSYRKRQVLKCSE